MNSLKGAMVIAVLGLAGLFTACSGDSAGSTNMDPMTQSSAQQAAETKAEVAKGKLSCTYMIGDSLLDYADIKIVYTDASGKQQTKELDKSMLKQEKLHMNSYTFDIETTTFPATMTAKLEVTPKQEAVDSAKTGVWLGLSKYFEYDTYDKNGKEISSKVLLGTKTELGGLAQIPAKSMKQFFAQLVEQTMQVYKMDKTVSVTVDKTTATHELK